MIVSVEHKFSEVESVNQVLLLDGLDFNKGLICLFLLILSVLRLEGILGMRQHVLRDRQSVLNRMPGHQSQRIAGLQIQ